MNSLLILTLAAYAWLWISLLVNVIIQHTLSHTHRHSLMYYMNKEWERDIRNVIPFRTRYYQSVMSRGFMHYHRHQHRPVPNPMGGGIGSGGVGDGAVPNQKRKSVSESSGPQIRRLDTHFTPSHNRFSVNFK